MFCETMRECGSRLTSSPHGSFVIPARRFNFEFGTVSVALGRRRVCGQAFVTQFAATMYEYPDFKSADDSSVHRALPENL
jgi:glucose dehydrogenase